jgi:hypothetical protein
MIKKETVVNAKKLQRIDLERLAVVLEESTIEESKNLGMAIAHRVTHPALGEVVLVAMASSCHLMIKI